MNPIIPRKRRINLEFIETSVTSEFKRNKGISDLHDISNYGLFEAEIAAQILVIVYIYISPWPVGRIWAAETCPLYPLGCPSETPKPKQL
jgi:hypothetical protein